MRKQVNYKQGKNMQQPNEGLNPSVTRYGSSANQLKHKRHLCYDQGRNQTKSEGLGNHVRKKRTTRKIYPGNVQKIQKEHASLDRPLQGKNQQPTAK